MTNIVKLLYNIIDLSSIILYDILYIDLKRDSFTGWRSDQVIKICILINVK